jgi:acetylornithine deacetylase
MKISYLFIPTLLSLSVQSSTLQQPIPAGLGLEDHDIQVSPQKLKPEPESSAEEHEHLNSIISSSPLLSFHRSIVQIPSISDNEKTVGDFILDFLSAHNFTTEKQVVSPATEDHDERFNIYAYTGEKRHVDILLTSHIDTVPPYIPYSLHTPKTTTTTSPSKFNRTDLLIAGRGTVDAKASVTAIIFAALETLKENQNSSAPISLGLLFTVGEENTGAGMKFFSSSDLNPTPPTFHTIIFGEPTDLNLVAGHKGTFGFKLTATGKAAHSGYPWLGRSAISSLLPVLSVLDGLEDRVPEEGGLLRSEKLGKSTLNIGILDGGVAGNVVPAFAEAGVKIRLAAGSVEDTRGIIERAVEEGRGKAHLKAGNGNGNGTCDSDGSNDASIELSFEGGSLPQFFDTDVNGFEVITVNYGTDAFSLSIGEGDHKVRRYLYGPGSIHVAHSDDEAITVGEIEEAVRGFKRLISAALSR